MFKNTILFLPEAIKAIFCPIDCENWGPSISFCYSTVPLKNYHLGGGEEEEEEEGVEERNGGGKMHEK